MSTAAFSIEPSAATLGATITGVRLAQLDEVGWAAIEDAFHRFGVLIFPSQHLSESEQVSFGRCFGELAIEVLIFSNRRDEAAGGGLLDADDPLMQLLAGNEGWHTDSSFRPLAAKASMLSAREVPTCGGETEWADMRAAYEALDAPTRARVAGLSAHHSLVYSQARVGAAAATTRNGLDALAAGTYRVPAAAPAGTADPPAERSDPLRPLVKHHPVTGRPALFIGRHAYGIPGLEPEESERLLDELVTFACQPPRVLSHRWQPGDLAVWDNRCLLHRARPFPVDQARVMVHTRVAGDRASELV